MSTARRVRQPSPPARWRPSLRGAALPPAGALAVDMLRYVLAYRGQAERVFSAEGHGYLALVIPWVAAALALALGGFLTRLARAWRGRGGRERPGVSTFA